MAKFAFNLVLKARKGLEKEVETFLGSEASLTRKDIGTLTWQAGRDEANTGEYLVFDTFDTEVAREEHLSGEAGKEFYANAERLFSEIKMYRVKIVAEK